MKTKIKCVGVDDNTPIFECILCGKRMLEEKSMCEACEVEDLYLEIALEEEWRERNGNL